MIYNPVLDLNEDEIIMRIVRAMYDREMNFVTYSESANHEVLRGKLFRAGVTSLTPKQIRDIWTYRLGWI